MIPGRPSSGSYGAGLEPTAPTIGSASAGNTTATVSFTASSYLGKTGTVTYTVTSSGGQSASGSSSPITVSGLSNGTSYTFTVRANAPYGPQSKPSAASNAATPVAPPTFAPPNFDPCAGVNCASYGTPPNGFYNFQYNYYTCGGPWCSPNQLGSWASYTSFDGCCTFGLFLGCENIGC